VATWLITGCSSGLGRALAEKALANGEHIIATARDPAQLSGLVATNPETVAAFALDVTDADQVRDIVYQAEARFGAIDVLVNNAGYGYRAAVEEGEPGGVEQVFATNFFGPVDLIQAVLPGMRARRSGTIINISSIGARVSPPGSGFYAATKAALEAMTASLRRELEPLGIRAMVVEPGAFRTDFAGRSLAQSPVRIADYASTAGQRRKENDNSHGTQPGDPLKAAEAIIAAANAETPPFMLILGSDALAAFGSSLDALRSDLEAWRAVSVSTDLAVPGGPSA
jgi:NAD(P)-dependent dehydrogenase (short-subunit alcohol dehydrogenase family)